MKGAILLAGVFSFLGMTEMPIGYYTFLRIYLTIISGVIVVNELSKENKVTGKVIMFTVIGIVFNPILPVYLHDKELWSLIDLIVGAVMLIEGLKRKNVKDVNIS